jgi:adenylate kinase family enzyme
MRIVVVGTSGAGKTVMARRIASALDLSCIELDQLHWEPNWEALSVTNPDEFIRRVSAAISADAWVSDGNYAVVRNLIWQRATHLVWLDYSRAVVMYRVIKRSVARALNQEELWAGNREDWRRWWRASHPIRWAWSTWRERRSRFQELLKSAQYRLGGTQAANPERCGKPDRSAQSERQPTLTAVFGASRQHKRHRYSITSSARTRIDAGMSRPSAFAAFRLTAISNLVGT